MKMKKLETKVVCAVALILIVFLIILGINGYSVGLWGSDFQNQYLQYLNYFKDLFHEKHVLIPDLVFGFGMIQNAAFFIYYGLLNPFIIIQRILGIDGLLFLNIIYFVTIISTLVLSYKLILNHVNNKKYAIIGSLLVCSNGFLINSLTYQIVFSMYLPVFLIGLLAIYHRKNLVLFIATMLIFNINYLMAVAVFCMYLVYTIYCSRSIKNTFIILILATLSSLYVILPIFYSIGMSTRLSPVHYLTTRDFVYTILKTFGYSFIPIICLFGFSLKKRDKILLGTVLFMGLLPFAPYISSLNTSGSHRFLVLLLPFVGIILAKVFENIKQVEDFNYKFVILLVLNYICVLYIMLHTDIEIEMINYIMIVYTGFIFIALAAEYLNRGKLVLILVFISSILNIGSFTQISKYEDVYVGNQKSTDTPGELFIENVQQFQEYGNEYNIDTSQVSMYSSLVNKNYISFLYDFVQLPIQFYREVGFIYSPSQLTDAILGIEPQVPMAYGRADMCSNSEDLSKLERTLVLVSNDFASDGNKLCTPVEPEYKIKLDEYKLTPKLEEELLSVKDKISNYIVYLNFDVPEDKGNISIEIDSQINTYKPLIKFENVNSNFTYYLDGNGDYKVNMYENDDGVEISNITVELYEKDMLINRYESNQRALATNITVDQKESKMSFSIDMEEQGWLVTKIPYDPAFKIEINGQESELIKVDNSFVGTHLDAGMNNVEIEYTMPMLKLGMSFSIIFIILSILYFTRFKYLISK